MAKRKKSVQKRPIRRKKAPSRRAGRKMGGWWPFTHRKKTTRGKKRTGKRFLWPLLKLGIVLAAWGIVALLALLAWFSKDLPDMEALLTPVDTAPMIHLYAADGSLLATIGGGKGGNLSFNQLAPELVQAVVATEDRRFFEHYGVDPWGILRAMFANVRAGRVVQGGSTITQQLAKNVFLTPERTLKRKIQEVLLALWIERNFSKEEIFALYMNRVYFGAGHYGVEAAAQGYFGKSARAVNLTEAALLAGLLKAPSRYSPHSNLKRAEARTLEVLGNMVEAGYLKSKASLRAITALRPQQLRSVDKARYFADWVAADIPQFVPMTASNLTVLTTLDPAMQRAAESSLSSALKGKEYEGALLAMSPDGAVRAMVGGSDYRKTQFNRATQAKRQPGSLFKLFAYLAALENNIRPDDVVEDKPIEVEGWAPENYGGDFSGEMTVMEALSRSINTVAVQLAVSAGLKRVASLAERLGIPGPFPRHPSIVLGTEEQSLLQMVQAYAHLASDGRQLRAWAVREIRNARGEIVYRRKNYETARVLQSETVGMMNRMLLSVVEKGTGRAAQIGRPLAGKTGTSQNHRDAWFVGYTPQLVAGVWLGRDDNQPMEQANGYGVTGGGAPARIGGRFLKQALKGQPVVPLRVERKPLWDSLGFGTGRRVEMPDLTPRPPEPEMEEGTIFQPEGGLANEAEVEAFWERIIGQE